jgi:hypothetical protein
VKVPNFGDQCLTVIGLRYIRAQAHNPAATARGLHRSCYLLRGLLRMVSPPAADDNRSPFQRQSVRCCAAQTIAAAGHKGHFSV